MTILRTVEVEESAAGVALVERDACGRVMQRIAMDPEPASHIGFELAKLAVTVLERTPK